MKALEVGLRKRIYALLSLFVLIVVVLMAGLYRHQVLERVQYLAWAEKQQLQPIRLIPLRGKILDRRGGLFFHTRPRWRTRLRLRACWLPIWK